MRNPLRSMLIAALVMCACGMAAAQEITGSNPVGSTTQENSGFASFFGRLFGWHKSEPAPAAEPAGGPAEPKAPAQTVTVIAPPPPADPNAWPAMPPNGTDMATLEVRLMDTDGDGFISHDEFVQEYERLFNSLPKNDQGLVSVQDLVALRSAAVKAAAATFKAK
jgi:hypothetical protein